MSHTGKLKPNLDAKSTKALNLTVLQRIDPFVEEILLTAAHVTFYGFNVDTGQWSRKDVEGSLFVVKRNAQPRFQFIVMNRRSTDNLVEDLLGDFEYEVQVPYLLYKNASQEVNGIWFYNVHDCDAVADLFSRILNAYAKVPTKSNPPLTKSEFDELESDPCISAVMEGPLESSSSTPNAADANFFSTAMNIGSSHNVSTTAVHTQNVVTLPTALPSAKKTPTSTSSGSKTSVMTIPKNPESSTGLVKPSSFFGSLPSTSPSIPLLQPFPPPNYRPVVTREKVKEALQMLVQDNQFIDIVYRAVVKAHES